MYQKSRRETAGIWQKLRSVNMDSIPLVALKRGIDILSGTKDVHALHMCAATAKGPAGTYQASTKIKVLQLSAAHILFRYAPGIPKQILTLAQDIGTS